MLNYLLCTERDYRYGKCASDDLNGRVLILYRDCRQCKCGKWTIVNSTKFWDMKGMQYLNINHRYNNIFL